MSKKNWAGSHTFAADRIHHPTSIDELADVVAKADRVRVLGSRHSFTDIADSRSLISMERMSDRFEVADDRSTITVAANITYGHLAGRLKAEGLAVHNLASLPHITVAGAIATGTHGSGSGNGNLATAVTAIELVTAGGELLRMERGHPDFDGMPVSLGALGAITAVQLESQPSFEVEQSVVEGVEWEVLEGNLDEVFAAGYSVSAFHRFGPTVDQLWIKTLSPGDGRPIDRFGGVVADRDRHPIIELPAAGCTPQRGQPGRWSDRLPHFRMEFSPNAGDELQSEYFVDRADGPAAIAALRAVGHELTGPLMVSELRTVAADELWMSPHHRRESLAIHFTWLPDAAATQAANAVIERALAPFDPRPHWGKVFTSATFSPARAYERLDDFLDLTARLDPHGTFRNPWFDRTFGV